MKSSDPADDTGLFTAFDASPRALVKGLTFRWVFFAVLWWGLTAGRTEQLALSVTVVTVSALLSCLLVTPQHINAWGTLKFIPFFIRLSIQGGLDVASRAFRPSMPLKTGFISYRLNLTRSAARVIFVWVVSLLPGTVSVQLTPQGLDIHVLDLDLAHEQRLMELEHYVNGLFRDKP